jgi:thioester reductase-like protein
VNLRSKLLYFFDKYSSEILIQDKKIYTYNEILIKAKIYKEIRGRLIYYGEKDSTYLSIFVASIIYDFTIIPIDIRQPEERLSQIIKDSNANYIYRNNNLNLLSKNEHVVKPQYIIYTSGTTGIPKGVMVSSSTIFNVIDSQIAVMSLSKEKIFWFVSIGFDASVSDILCAIFSGSTLYVNDSILMKPKKLMDYIRDNQITYSDLPPSYIKLLDFSKTSLNKLLLGGEKFEYNMVKPILEEGIRIFNAYGPTETTICTSLSEIKSEVSLGKPFSHITYLIDKEELLIGGDCLSLGYTDANLNNSFIYFKGKPFYRTGDYVYQNPKTGIFYFKGRGDTQIKKNGQLINLMEIEAVITNSLSENVIVKYEHSKINLYHKSLDIKEVKKIVDKKLPKYMRINNFKKISKIPLTERSKVDRIKVNNFKFFLTGATGFFGTFILRELLKETTCDVYCLVRGSEAYLRLKKQYESYTKENIDEYRSRIILINKDLSELSEQDLFCFDSKDIVIHSAAIVNNINKIDKLLDTNVNSLDTLSRLFKKNKKIFISSLSVQASLSSIKIDLAEAYIDKDYTEKDYNNSYAYSKYLAEKKIKKDLTWTIIRLGLLVADSNFFSEPPKNFLRLLLEGLKDSQDIPLINKDIKIDYTPVDLASKILIDIIVKDKLQKKVYHLSFNSFITWKIILKKLHNKQINSSWFIDNKYKLLSNFFGEYNPICRKKNMNIFESTDIDFFVNDNIKKYIDFKVDVYRDEYLQRIFNE